MASLAQEAIGCRSCTLYLTSDMFWLDVLTDTGANWGTSLLAILTSYLVGCFTAGYYLVRFHKGIDIRREGSGSAGATNAGRATGPAGFVITFTIDLVKGVLVAWMAIHFGLGSRAQMLCALAVIGGHIWPVQLRFRGGKGVATLLGVMLITDFRVILMMAALCVLALAFIRRFTLSGLAALAATPAVAAFALWPPGRALSLLVLTLPVLYAHRQNIREDVSSMRFGLVGKSSGGPTTRKE